jgi:hypothetical protein
MSRIGEAKLATRVRDELVTFLRNGTINEQRVAQALDITDLQIENIDRLKRIHFCLSEPVIEYVDQLQNRLRRIKTANQRERVATRGEVRGKIDWEETLKHRYSDSIGDRSRFTCETPYTEHNIAENLVLKKLLWVIHHTVESDLSDIDYAWRKRGNKWSDERISAFERLYGRNVHVNRIADGEDITVTPRMLNDTRSARQSLYTEAYTLYDRYQRFLSNEPDDDISELLQETLIIPERLPRLFELFCVFQLLDMLNLEGLQYQVIEPGADQLATMETSTHQVDVYHDRGGALTFYVPLRCIEEVEEEYFRRYRSTLKRHKQLVDEFLDINSRQSMYSGRPDLVIEVYEKTETSRQLRDVVLGEIKYTDSRRTFSSGLKELLEYIEFAQYKSSSGDRDITYLDEQGIDVWGLIITDGVDTEKQTQSGKRIAHLTSEDLASSAEFENAWAPGTITD